MISILRKQEQAANDTKEFLKASGLKSKYVAAKVGIDEQSFSKFLNHRMALSERQLLLLETYKDGYEGVYDLRIANLTCVLLTRDIHPEACGGFVVTRNKSNIVIIDESHNDVYQTDYCNWLYHFLQGKRDKFRFQARDNRLCVVVGGRAEYLYHIVMAIHLYGVPASEYSLRKKLRQFREEYIEKGYNVDHLDTDVNNNCLSNLIVMTIAQNSRKAELQSKIRKLELPLFCWQERYDDTSIRAMAEYVDPLRSPKYLLHGVFSVEEYLTELEKVVVFVRNNVKICEDFSDI